MIVYALPRHRRAVHPDAVPTTFNTRTIPFPWLDVVPVPTGRYTPRHRRGTSSL